MKRVRKLIGVILSDVTAEYQERILKGIMEQALVYDYNVAVFTTFIKGEGTIQHMLGERNIFRLPNYDKLDGIIFVPYSISMENVASEVEVEIKKKFKGPIICADMSECAFPKILKGDKEEMKVMVNHFIKIHGFTRINFLAGPKDHIESQMRLQGYKDALSENNISIDLERIYYGDFWKEAPKLFVDKIMKSKNPMPQAIVCANDFMAITVCDTLKEYGIRVPMDICVSGYDNIKAAGQNTPTITTIKSPIEEIGRRAVKAINESILGVIEKDNSVACGELILADSCGCGNHKSAQNTLDKFINYQIEVDIMKEDFARMNQMGESLIRVSTIEDFLIELSSHVYLLKDYSDFYLCLCEDWDAIGQDGDSNAYFKDGYSENMNLLIAVKNYEFISRQNFKSKDMLPELYQENETMKTYFFVPIHFNDRCFGYAALSYGQQNKIYDFTYRSWIQNISNTLEFVRVQNNLRWCYDQLDEIAVRDALTGIYNRRGFDRYAQSIYAACVSQQKPFQLLIGDLDKLKLINDQYGHIEGDKAIITVAKAFQSLEAKNSICARIGGDEFVIIFDGNESKEQIISYKQEIYDYLIAFNADNEPPYSVCMSIGIYYGIPSTEVTMNDCLVIADKSMYEEKNRKKNHL